MMTHSNESRLAASINFPYETAIQYTRHGEELSTDKFPLKY